MTERERLEEEIRFLEFLRDVRRRVEYKQERGRQRREKIRDVAKTGSAVAGMLLAFKKLF